MKRTLQLDKNFFHPQAIKHAAYDFGDIASIVLRGEENNQFLVEISGDPIDDLERKFRNSVLDHQLRIEVNREFKTVRELIIAQAFSPVDNLEDLLPMNSKTR